MTIRALIIDDDSRLRDLLATYLRQHEIELFGSGSGKEGLIALEGDAFDLVLLDVMMPLLDGLEVLRRIRAKSGIPLIMLTARGDETDRVVGLELGADDYVAKPFSPRELLARIRAVLRRTRPALTQEYLSTGGVTVDLVTREVQVGGQRVDLSGVEFAILVALMRRAGRVVGREVLLSEAGRHDVVVGERAVDVHISHLRRKLRDSSGAPWLIKTVRGAGYVFARERP